MCVLIMPLHAPTAIHANNLSFDKPHQQWRQHFPKSCKEAVPDQHRHCSASFAFQYTLSKTLTAAAHPVLRRMSKHQALALDARANLRLKCSITALCLGNALQCWEYFQLSSEIVAASWIPYIIPAQITTGCFLKWHNRAELQKDSFSSLKNCPKTDVLGHLENWILCI